jgi:P pilus assembly chaperone PapD
MIPFRLRMQAVLVVAVTVLVLPRFLIGQVTGEVDIRGGHGAVLVRNRARSPMDVTVALWESDESGERVQLLGRARANLWPLEFRLRPGESQTVRVLTTGDPYDPGTLLRLETRFIPVAAQQVAGTTGTPPTGARAEIRIVTRILSKVWIR